MAVEAAFAFACLVESLKVPFLLFKERMEGILLPCVHEPAIVGVIIVSD